MNNNDLKTITTLTKYTEDLAKDNCKLSNEIAHLKNSVDYLKDLVDKKSAQLMITEEAYQNCFIERDILQDEIDELRSKNKELNKEVKKLRKALISEKNVNNNEKEDL